jgi:EAL domain-containing protein (putative c-di-GMP-specific phosphodiesterase class I)
LAFLGTVACDCAQGYYVSPPVTAAEMPKVITRWDQKQHRRAAEA